MPHLNVLDNVAFGLELDGVGKETSNAHWMLSSKFVLTAWGNAMTDELGGGMQ